MIKIMELVSIKNDINTYAENGVRNAKLHVGKYSIL